MTASSLSSSNRTNSKYTFLPDLIVQAGGVVHEVPLRAGQTLPIGKELLIILKQKFNITSRFRQLVVASHQYILGKRTLFCSSQIDGQFVLGPAVSSTVVTLFPAGRKNPSFLPRRAENKVK